MTVVLEVLFFSYLLFVAAFDWRRQLLPIEPMAGATLVGLLVQFFDGDVVSSLIGLSIGAGFLGLQHLISRGRWMGVGDIWLGASIGAWLGFQGTIVAFYFCYLFGGLVAAILLALGRQRGTRVPFAPFLAFGAAGSVLFADPIIDWFSRAMGW